MSNDADQGIQVEGFILGARAIGRNPSQTATQKILIVEDNDLNRDMLTRRLKRLGYHVIEARNGREALEMVCSDVPDLIFMDMSLPEIDGCEATRRLKEDPETAMIPIIALTAHAFEQDRQKAMDAGCNDFTTKPIVWDELLEKMKAFLGNSIAQLKKE